MNSINSEVLHSIFRFTAIDLKSKSIDQIVSDGLKLFCELASCNYSALFLFDKNTFELNFYSISNFEFVGELNSTFEKFTDEGIISKAIVEGEIVEEMVVKNKTENFFSIIPLNVPNGMIGIVIIKKNSSLLLQENLLFYLNGFSINFALLLDLSLTNIAKKISSKSNSSSIVNEFERVNFDYEFLAAVLNSTSSGIILIDKQTTQIIFGNEYALNILAINSKKIIGTKITDYFLIHTSIASSNKPETFDGLIHKDDGTLIPVLMKESSFKYENKTILIYSFVDNSELKRYESELQKAHFLLEQRVEVRTEQLLDSNSRLVQEIKNRENAEAQLLKFMWVVEQNPIGILILETNGQIRYANKKYGEIVGETSDKILGHFPQFFNLAILNISKDNFESKVSKGEFWKSEILNTRKGDEEFWMSLYIAPIADTRGVIINYFVLIEEITEKKQVLDELVNAKLNAEQSNNFKSYLLANMSHEFRTPLISILGYAQILENEVEDNEHREMIDVIKQGGNRLLKTLDGMLQLSDIEARKISMKPEKINFEQIVDHIADKYLDQIQEKGIELKLNVKFDEIFFYSDLELLQVCLFHIFDNAIKFTNSGIIALGAENISEDGVKKVDITVSDTGIGIEEEKLSHIFSAFHQGDEGLTRNYEGAGLGLTISNRIVELLDGKLKISSRQNEGTKITIKLPIIPAAFQQKLV